MKLKLHHLSTEVRPPEVLAGRNGDLWVIVPILMSPFIMLRIMFWLCFLTFSNLNCPKVRGVYPSSLPIAILLSLVLENF